MNQSVKYNRDSEVERGAERKSTGHLSQLNFASNLNGGVSVAITLLTRHERDYWH